MSYNKIQDFDLNFLNSGNENQNKLIYLKDIQNKSLKINNKLIIKNNATSKILSDNTENNELITITGNLLTNKSVFSQEIISNNSLHIKKTNDLLDASDLFKIIKNTNTSNIDINSYSSPKKTKISSKNQILFTEDINKSFYAQEIIGQFIYDTLGNPILKGQNGINIEVKEKSGKKYFEVDYSSKILNNSNTKLSYKTVINWNQINTAQSDADINSEYAFSSNFITPQSVAINSQAKKSRLKLVYNNLYKNWSVGKHFIHVDTSAINSNSHASIGGVPTISRYEMIVDLSQSSLGENDRKWKQGDELYFYLNLQSVGYDEQNKEVNGILISSKTIATNPEYFSGTTRTLSNASGKTNVLKLNQHQTRSNNLPSISYYTFENAAIMQFWTPISSDGSTAPTIGDILLLKTTPATNTSIITIYPTSSTSPAFKMPSSSSNILCLKYNGTTWIDVTTNEYDTHIQTINYNLNPTYNRFQYVFKMPQNHKMFIDNNVSKLQNAFVFKKAVDTFDSVWYNDNLNDFNFIGKSKLINISEVEDCIIFNPGYNGSSFSLRFLGYEDPSNPGIGTWIIR